MVYKVLLLRLKLKSSQKRLFVKKVLQLNNSPNNGFKNKNCDIIIMSLHQKAGRESTKTMA